RHSRRHRPPSALPVGRSRSPDRARSRLEETGADLELHAACRGLRRSPERGGFAAVHQCAQLRPRDARDGGLSCGARRFQGMTEMAEYRDIGVELSGHVATIEIQRPPNNFFDVVLINSIADALDDLDKNNECRAVVLAAQGKSFCAGANFGDGSTLDKSGQRPGEEMAPIGHLYMQAVRLFRSKKPIVGAIHGAAVGGGLGLSMVPDFRVACPETRFAANFTRLGFHPGFGLTETLPAIIGKQNATMMFYTSRRIGGEEARRMGLADLLVPQDQVRAAAQKLAADIAENAPLAILATRLTMRHELADRVKAATEH